MTRPVLATVTDAIAPYHAGGKEQRTDELARRLSDRFEVHVHTMRWWGVGATRRDGAVTLHGVCRARDLYAAGTPGSGGRRSIAQALGFAAGCLRLLTARFDVLEADHMPYLHLPLLWLVAKVRRRPFVITWHEVWSLAYWRSYLGPAGVIAWAVERTTMLLPDLVVAASDLTATRVRAAVRGRVPVVVAPNGVDTAAVARALAAVPDDLAGLDGTGPVDVVTVGRLLPHKRVDLLLDALALLAARGRTVRARVIGRGPEEASLRARAAELGLDVAFRPDVTDSAELARLVAAARLFVLPSAREGFGIVALEGVACGLPVLTTDAPDNLARLLVAGAPGGMVCDDDVAALADAIADVLDHPPVVVPDDRRAWLAGYGWDATADRVAAALDSLLPARPPSCRPTPEPAPTRLPTPAGTHR